MRWKRFYQNEMGANYQSVSVGIKGESKGHRKRGTPLRLKVKMGVHVEVFVGSGWK